VIYTDNDYGQSIYESFATNVVGLEIDIENDEKYRKIRAENESSELSDETKDDIEDALNEIVRNQLKIIVYLGDVYVGAYLAKEAYSKELYGEYYAWIGGMWLNDEMIALLDTEYSSDKDDILEVLNGAIGLGLAGPVGAAGEAFTAAYAAEYGADYTPYAMYAYDAVYLYAYTIQAMLEKGDDINNGSELMEGLRAADFKGASGSVKITEGSNDRNSIGYLIINMQDGVPEITAVYDPANANLFVNTDIELQWSDDQSSPPDDEWDTEYDCPFAEHMVTLSSDGQGVVGGIIGSLFVITLILGILSYMKWRSIEI
jgi:ABC-type branched-subunit amino acid transport system substrate-binding protein